MVERTGDSDGVGAARRVTIAGGGIGAIEAMLALRALVPAVEIELLAPQAAFEYAPLSILAPFGIKETPVLGLAHIAEEHGVSVERDSLSAIDPLAHTVATGRGARLGYDLLIVATGALPVDGVPGATAFRGPRDRERVSRLLEECAQGAVRRLAFAVPGGAAWTLPAYELALLTALEVRGGSGHDLEIEIVTPETAPLELFGPRASETVAELLEDTGVSLRASTYPERFEDGVLWTRPRAAIEFDRVVALPRPKGRGFPGLPSDGDGFIPTDRLGRVEGVDDVYAVGDVTTFPVKQGGIACQQADAAASAIAASVGAAVEPEPFEPVMRGLLMTGITARYLEFGAAGGHGDGAEPRLTLWEPSSKVFGRHLLPYLRGRARHDDAAPDAGEAAGAGAARA
jgi:sulfide:quinone oxidoreductase